MNTASLLLNPDGFQQVFEQLRKEYSVPGVSAALFSKNVTLSTAQGISNIESGEPVTENTAFQIGSASKLFTAVLILQLIEQGHLELDMPVVRKLPTFRTALTDYSSRITVRQCLNHSSGLAGDFFPDDDAEGPSVSSYMQKIRDLPSVYPPGEGPMMYGNGAYVILGALLEAHYGKSWNTLVNERICEPLNLTPLLTDHRQANDFELASGHCLNSAGVLEVASPHWLPLSMAPAGTVLSMPASQLLGFGVAFMHAGKLLGPSIHRSMLDQTCAVPPFSLDGVTHWGLGPMIGQYPGYTQIGHGGMTRGHFTQLWCFPDRDCAYAICCNAPSGLFAAFHQRFVEEFLECETETPLAFEAFTPDPHRYCGHYQSIGTDHTVYRENGHFKVRISDKIFGAETVTASLQPYRDDVFDVIPDPGSSPRNLLLTPKLSFLGTDAQGRAQYSRAGVRLPRRVE